MLERILVPVDDSELSHRILGLVRRLLLAERAQVRLVRVLGEGELDPTDGERDTVARTAHGRLARIVEQLQERGVRASSALLTGEPATEILRYADTYEPSLIALASHGRSGAARWIRGSTAERLLRGSRFPLLLANPIGVGESSWLAEVPREPALELTFGRILVPLDGSEASAAVLPAVAELARLYGSEVVLFHAVDRSTTAQSKARLAAFGERLPGVRVSLRTAEGKPAAAIVDAACSGLFDLTAMTTHGSGTARWAFGSTAEHVLRHVACPLLVVRPKAPGEKG